VLLGSGAAAVADLGIATIADALRPEVADITVIGPDGDDAGDDGGPGDGAGPGDVRVTLRLR
jgi:hypothetical protein